MASDDKRRRSVTPTEQRLSRQKRQRIHAASSAERYHVRRLGVPSPVNLYSFQVSDRASPDPPRSKSKEGHFRFHNGDSIGSRYKILSLIGEGTFGRVLECWDRKRKVTVAIKVIRSVPKYREAAMIELEVLNTLRANDHACTSCCIHLQHWFDYRGHVCIVFERLGASLYDFMRKNGFRPFPLDVVQRLARQLLHAIAFMHSLNIVHTDLKPENVLLVDSDEYAKLEPERCGRLGCRVPLRADIRVIDFGSATFEDERHSSLVSTRHYRAPEVILGLGWSFECDLWSAGCIIVELITGRALFQTHENLEHLAMMERVLDRIPPDLVKCASSDARKYFSAKDRTLLWSPDTVPHKSVKAVQQLSSLRRLLRVEADTSVLPHLDALHGLLSQLMMYRPRQRLSARECLTHDFFRESIRSLLPRRERSRDAGSVGAASERVRPMSDTGARLTGAAGSVAVPSSSRQHSKHGASEKGAAADRAVEDPIRTCDAAAGDWQGGGAAKAAAPSMRDGANHGACAPAAPCLPAGLQRGRAPVGRPSGAAPAVTRSVAKALAASKSSGVDERLPPFGDIVPGGGGCGVEVAAGPAVGKAVAARLYGGASGGGDPGMALDDDAPPSDVEESLPFVSAVTPMRSAQTQELLSAVAHQA